VGILSGKDLLSGKHVTAEILDSSQRLHYVPIKHTIGDFFLTTINRDIYCFKLDLSRMGTYKETATKSFRKINYSTKNYMPISAGDNKALEDLLRINNLPKVNYKLFRTLKLLGNREKTKEIKDFTAHSLVSLVEEVSQHEDEYTDQVRNITSYLQHLQVDQIVTPVREVTEFLDEELIAGDPRFLGDIVSTLQRVDQEHKKVTNVPMTGKIPWFKMLLIISLVGILGGVGYWVYSSGALSNFSVGGFLGTPANSQSIMQEYPTPEALKVAIQQGKVKESDLPPDIKREVDAVKLPTAPAH
jgi:hypothetical protein